LHPPAGDSNLPSKTQRRA